MKITNTNEIGPRVFRTSFKAAVLGLAAAAALTACGGQVKLGAAAIVGGQRITDAKLDQIVSDYQTQLARDPAAKQLQEKDGSANSESPPRNALFQLVSFRIFDEVAREQHLDVTPTQVDRVVAASGGQQGIDDRTLAGGLPVSHSRDLVRALLIRSLLLQRFGAVTNAQGQVDQQSLQQAQQELVLAQKQALRTLKITINPRYGTFDPNSGFGAVVYKLSKADSGLNGAG